MNENIHKRREILLANWLNIVCSYMTNQNDLERPGIEFPFITKSIIGNIKNVIAITILAEERQILRETINLISQLDEQNKQSTELDLNENFLRYVQLIGEENILNYFANNQNDWLEGLNRVKRGTSFLKKLIDVSEF